MKAILATLETAGQHEGENVEESLVEQAILRSCSHPAVVAGTYNSAEDEEHIAFI